MNSKEIPPNFFLLKEGQQTGPFLVSEILEKLQSGMCNSEDFVWREGLPEWVQIQNLSELSGSKKTGSFKTRFQEDKKFRVIVIAGAAGLALAIYLLLFSGGNPPRSVVEQALVQRRNALGKLGIQTEMRDMEITYGATLESRGRNGPVGTTVYPVRVDCISVDDGKPLDVTIYFYKNEFGEWCW